MAAYASTVTLGSPKAYRIPGTPFGFLCGMVDITNYNTTTAEETTITGKFKPMTFGASTYKCILVTSGDTDNGYSVNFNPVTGKFKAYKEASANAEVEVASDVDVGAFPFIAFGLTL